MNNKEVSILLVGIGGFGGSYVNELLENEERDFKITGVVDPLAEQASCYPALREKNIPFYAELENFYAEQEADLAVISSPIHFHCPQSTFCLSQGSSVLCEKPLAAVVQDGLKMKKARDETGEFLDIGYQWSHSEAVLKFKQDVLDGVLGRPLRARTIILWPRDQEYYARNSWAGRIKDDKGHWVLDSVANNATAHYLHNLFFVLGPEINKSSYPSSLTAELYRANDIENYDTAVTRIKTEEDLELLYYASHSVRERYQETFCFEFEKGRVVYGELEQENQGTITAEFNDGTKKYYGNPEKNRKRKLWLALEAVRKGEDFVYCGPEAALPQTISINGFQESAGEIRDYPEDIKNYDRQKQQYWIEDLDNILIKAYREEKLLSEMDIKWARRGNRLSVEDYDHYPSEG